MGILNNPQFDRSFPRENNGSGEGAGRIVGNCARHDRLEEIKKKVKNGYYDKPEIKMKLADLLLKSVEITGDLDSYVSDEAVRIKIAESLFVETFDNNE